MATQKFEPFSGKLDAATEFESFDGTLDGEKPKPTGALRKLGDLGIGFASGAVGATKAIADAAGAGNKASSVLSSLNTGINDYLSPAAKADQQEQGQILADASGKGTWEGVKAGARAFGVAPVQTAVQGLGSIVPILAGTALTGGAAPAAAVGAGIGAAMGTGTAKGAIYDEIKKRGGTEEEAIKAQEYGGANTDQIALGGALGTADALTGVSKMAGNMLRNAVGKPVLETAKEASRGIIGRSAMGLLSEMPLEAAQGGQEQVAANLAAQRAGYQAGTWDNVASNATMEALASAGPGAMFGAMDTGNKQPPPPPPPADIPPAPPADPMLALPSPNIVVGPDGTATTAQDRNARLARIASGDITDVTPIQKPSEQMGIDPSAGVISSVAAQAVDTGVQNTMMLDEASDRDQAAYEQAMAEQDSIDKPITSGAIAESQMSDEDKRAVLFSNQSVADGGLRFEGTQDGDILNGMAAPFATRMAAARRANMEGKDWTIAPVFDGWVARRKDAFNGADAGISTATTGSSEQGSNQPASSVGSGATDGNAVGADTAGYSGNAVGEPRQLPAGGDDAAVAKGREGYDTQVTVDASRLKSLIEQTRGESLVDKPAKLEAWRNGTAKTDPAKFPIEIAVNARGKLDVNDGRHRIALAAERGEQVEAFIDGKDVERLNEIIIQPEKQEQHTPALREQLSNVEQKDNEGAQTAPDKRQKAIDRIAKGTAYFGTNLKAAKYIADNDLKDTHEAVKTAANRWDIQAKAVQPVSQPQEQTLEKAPEAIESQTQPEAGPSAGIQEPAATAGVGGTAEGVEKPSEKQWTRTSTAEREAIIAKTDIKPLIKKNIVNKAWADLNGDIQKKLAKAMEPAAVAESLPDKPKDEGLHMANGRAAFAEGKPRVLPSYFTKPGDKNSKDWYRGWDAANAAAPVAKAKGLGEQLAELNNELDRQGSVQNANTRAQRDSIRKQIAQQDFPDVLKAVDDNIDVAEELNSAFKYAGDEPKAKTIARILQKRGVTPEYQARWTERLMDGQNDELDAEMQSYEAKANPTYSGEPAGTKVPKTMGSGLESAGFIRLERGDPRRYQKYGTWERDGVRVALSGQVTGAERGTVMKYQADDGEMTIEAIITDPSQRGNGLAKKALGEIASIADSMGITLYAEPVQIEQGQGLTVNQLNSLYGTFGFEPTDQSGLVLERKPGAEQKAPTAPASPAPAATETVAVKANTVFTEDAAAAARARLKAKLNRLNSGIDPEMLMDGIILSGYHIEKGARTFVAYAQAMIGDLGDGVKPYLKSWYMATKYDPRASSLDGLDDPATMDAVDLNKIGIAEPAPTEVSDMARANAKSAGEAEAAKWTGWTGKTVATAKVQTEILDSLSDAYPEGEGLIELSKDIMDEIASDELAKPAKSADTVNKDTPNANPVQPEAVPAGSGAQAEPDAAPGAGNSEPVGTGMAGTGESSDLFGTLPASPANAGGTGTRNTEQSGTKPPGKTRNSAGVRTEPVTPGSGDFEIDAEDIGKGGLTKKYRDNVEAIKIIKALESESRTATPEERKQIARYVGWGAIKGVFDPANKQWGKQHEELKGLLTEAEWRAARKSALNAHFTSPIAVNAMYSALERLGFKSGRVLESSVGIGNFFGLMPKSMRGASSLHGVELDSLTSRLVAALYPKAKVTNSGFEDFDIPAEYFDLTIGNPPFGSEPIVDMERSAYSGFSIHNYFLAKSIDKLRPGGIMQVVVSHSFMDSQDEKARKWIADRASLIGAARLPNTAFKGNSGTEVVTDILIFQKHDRNGLPKDAAPWVKSVEQTNVNPKTGESAKHSVGEFFVNNPQFVLGTPSAAGSMYAANEYTVEPSGDLAQQLEGWVKSLPQDIYEQVDRTADFMKVDMAVPDGVKAGSYFVSKDGQVMQRGPDVMGEKSALPWEPGNLTAPERMKGMIALRDSLRSQMRLERSLDATNEQIEANREKMNVQYDAFLKKFGHLNNQVNRKIFLDDTESQLLQALEFDYDKGVSKSVADREEIEPRDPSATKADIFKRRVAFPQQDYMTVTTAKDALLASLNYRGKIDLDYMQEVYGKTGDEVIKELGDLVFDDPMGEIAPADEYLSGDVKTKLVEAKAAAQSDPKYKRNVDELEKVIPVDKKPSEISVSLGAAFVPAEYYANFVTHISGGNATPVYIKATGQWVTAHHGQTDPALNTGKYGTSELSAKDLFDLSMLGRGAIVKRISRNPDGSTTTVVLEKETEAAREKQNAIKAEWQSWLWGDATRADNIAKIFNEKMNRTVDRKYDGSHLTFPGMNPAISLLAHQKNGVWRGLQSYQVLYDHVVGAGKTFEMATLAMEMRRLGISRKPLFIVPNHLTLQWRSEFTRLYPGSNILAATPEDFSKDNRERMFSKITTGDWDAVVIGHSSLKKIGLPEETEKAVLQEQIDEVSSALEEMKRGRGDRNIIRDMEGIRARLEAKMKEKLAAIGKRSKVLTFDELGIDAMFIDEMHEFKNLTYNSTMDRNPGMGNPAGSGKAFDMFVKTRWMFDTFGAKTPYITATGTPVSNSLVEMFNMQRYMQYPTLKKEGLHVFDAWAKQFGSVENVYEVAPSGSGFRQSTRFAKFTNLPALMGLYNRFADTVTLDDLKAQEESQGKKFPVPRMVGGKPTLVVAKRSPRVAALMGVPKAQVDEAGNIKFQSDLSATITIAKDPKSDKFTLHVGESYLGNYDTEQDAKLKLVERALTPEVSVEPSSILGRFANLKQLTRETKGKVNALSLTGEANKAGLDYRLIDPSAPDFAGSKINLAVNKAVEIYKQWADDKGTQLIFCDLSIPLSARSSYTAKPRRLYVRGDVGELAMKRGTMHTLEGHEDLPYFVVQRGDKDQKRFDVYDAATGMMLRNDYRTKTDAIEGTNGQISDDALRQKLIDKRQVTPEIDQDAIDDYNSTNEVETEGIEFFGPADIAGVSGNAKFSVYDDIKAKLILNGIPEREIAFIHDYQTPVAKDKLFKAVKTGEIRFLLGSTQKMGAGTNVQDRLVGLHHIDAPWRPSDLEQREGRIIRRGNFLYARDPDGFEVFVGRYATEMTYDTRRWQILEHKARGIEQLRNFDGTMNEIDDIEGEASNSADMKAAASGDPLILEETKLKNEVRRMEQLQAGHADEVLSMTRKASLSESMSTGHYPQEEKTLRAMVATTAKFPVKKGEFAPITINGKAFSEKESAEAQVNRMATQARTASQLDDPTVVIYRGLEFTISSNGGGNIKAESPTGTMGHWNFQEAFSASGFIQRMANYVDRLSSMADNAAEEAKKSARDAVAMREQAKAPFAQAADLERARNEYRKVQRTLLARGPEVPESQKKAVADALVQQKAKLESLGYGDALREFFGSKDVGGGNGEIDVVSSAAMAKANFDPDDSEAAQVEAGIKGKSLLEVAKWIGDNGSPVQSAIASKVHRRLNMLKMAGVKLGFHLVHVGDTVPAALIGSRGLTNYKFHPSNASMDVYINAADVTGYVGVSFETVLHELVHASTMAAVRLGNMKIAQGTKLADDVGDLFDVTRAIIRHFNQRVADSKAGKATLTPFEQQMFNRQNNAFQNPSETLTWALTDPEAQAFLETIPYKSKTAWTAFVEAVRNFLGLPASMDTALSEVLRVAEALMDDNINEMIPLANSSGTALATQQASDQWSMTAQHSKSSKLGDAVSQAANNVHDVTLPAGYTVGDLLKSAPGKLNWWHKSVGTMYNLAERSPQFKRVFDGVQNFINDVSFYATEAADLAPNILPKLETWKDITKSPLSAEDTKAISAPIFEGTLTWARDESGKPIKIEALEAQAATLKPEQKAQRLLRNDMVSDKVLKMWQGLPIDQYEAIINGKYERDMLKAGVVWTDAELKSMFNLSDKQIPLYREFREATDKSLTNLAISDMLRFGGKDVAPIREQVLAQPNVVQAGDMLRDYLMDLSDMDETRKDVLLDTANKMVEKADKAQDLIARGYAPLSRYGQYTLDVVSPDGERVYFGMFENKMDAARMARRMEQEFPGAKMTRGTVSEEEYKLFAGVSPETLELFGDMLGLEAQGDDAASKAFQTYLKLAKSNRSSMKRLIQRKGIAGFSEDSGRVLAGFVYSNARQTASNLHMGEMSDAANEVSKVDGELKDQAVRLVDYVKNPREEAQAFRGLLFAQYIGGSVASAMVNMTQPITMTFPWLSQYGSVADAAKRLTTAMKDANKKQTGDARLDAALHRAEEDGTVSPQEVHQLMQQSQGRGALRSGDGTKAGDAMATANNALSRFSLGWGKLFSMAEQFNRRVTFIAAYRTAVEQGIENPDGFARKAIAETQGVYNKGNKPAWARGAIGSTLFTFKQYSIAYVEMLQRMATQGGPEGKKAAMLALGVLFLMSGAGGMPGGDDLDDLISGVMQRLGYNFDSKTKRKEFFADLVGEGGAKFLESGISGLPGMPIDVSGRLGMGNLIPGTGLLVRKTDHTRDLAEIAGPAGDFGKRIFETGGKALDGNLLGASGAAATVAPKAIQNLVQSYDMANMGMYRDAKGMKVLDTGGADALLKAIGFQPNDVKKVQDASFEAQRMIGLNKLRETEIANRWALGIFEKDTDKVKAARDELAQWNTTNPESPIRINFSQILQRVKKMNQSKSERIQATAPKEIRADVRRSLEIQ